MLFVRPSLCVCVTLFIVHFVFFLSRKLISISYLYYIFAVERKENNRVNDEKMKNKKTVYTNAFNAHYDKIALHSGYHYLSIRPFFFLKNQLSLITSAACLRYEKSNSLA